MRLPVARLLQPLLLLHARPLPLRMQLPDLPSQAASASGGTAAPVRHYCNLSNGLEAMALLEEAGVPASQLRFMRVQSSHCEAQDFNGILSGLDHDLLLHLALGFECRVYDFGSRGNVWVGDDGGEEQRHVPRAIWWGMEWASWALGRLWKLPERPALLRGVCVDRLFKEKLDAMPKPLAKRLRYYRNYLAPGLDEVRLRGCYAEARHDGEKAHYAQLASAYTAAVAAEQREQPPPTPAALGLGVYDSQTAIRVGITRPADWGGPDSTS